MKLHKFKDYNEYKTIQIKGYEAKVDTHSWVDPYSIRGLTSYIFDYNSDVSFGLCHGTRRGIEQKEFIQSFESLNKIVEVVGTEIAPEASKRFSNTIEWDFHEVKDEWIGNIDFIYSNSLDHSHKPEYCLNQWMKCLNGRGLCIIEWTSDDDKKSRPMDPFAASYAEYIKLIENKYEIVDILESEPDKDESWNFKGQRFYFIIRNRRNNETN